MEVKTDVAIVGAGPAGSTLASLLARRGLTVALIDRDGFPRDKLCGEFLSYDALPILDALGVTGALDQRDAPQISSCRIIGRRAVYEFGLPRPARGVSRKLLDYLLVRCAVDSGATDWTGWTATKVSSTSVEVERSGEKKTIAARAVAGAWGRWGRFDAQLGRRFVRDRAHRHFGFKRHYRARMQRSGTIDLYTFHRGYLGVSPVEGNLTNICGLVHASRLSGLKGRWEAFVAEIREEQEPLDRMYSSHEPAEEGFLSSEPVIFRARSAVEGGVLMIGDASGIIDPLTGNGMAMAIQSALIAAPAVLRLMTGPDRQKEENLYRTAHRDFFAPRIRWSRGVARLLSHPSILEAAMRFVRTPRAGQFLLARTRAAGSDVERIAASWFW